MLSTILMFVIVVGGSDPSECSADWKPLEIHGIRLGMTVTQVKFRLPFLKIPPADKYDVRETFLYVTTNPRQRKRLPRVFAIEMWFWKNRLVRYNLKYYGAETPDGIARFMDAVETHFNLSDATRISAHRYQCGNVSISVAEDVKRTVSLRDLEGEKVLNRRVDESYGLKP
jgi:hypothetical protein